MNSIQEWMLLDTTATRLNPFTDSEEDDVFSDEDFATNDCMFCASPEDIYMKKIWKKLSKGTTMDNMRTALQNDEEYRRHLEEVKEKLGHLIDESNRSNDNITYEKLFSNLAEVDYSQTCDQDLETLVRQAVAKQMGSLPQEMKENIFSEWDKIVDKDYRSGQT